MADYNWQYVKVGGVTRINITSGNDIANLRKLDPKLWTVLGCPASGLEFNDQTLKILDTDNDGMIHIDEVINAAEYLTSSLEDPDFLLRGEDSLPVTAFSGSENGNALKEAAEKVLSILGPKDGSAVSLQDADDAIGKMLSSEVDASAKVEKVAPFGDDSDNVEALVSGISAKIDDWFLRCRLAAYNSDSFSKLNVSPDKIAEVGENMLTDCLDKISSYPITQINPEGLLPLAQAVNPAWDARFRQLKSVFEKEFPGETSLSESQWNAFKAKVASYTGYKCKVKENAEALLKEKNDTAASIFKLRDFILLYRDFYQLLKNFVTLTDFYSRNPETLSVFQAGRLYIDQRCCDLCVKVSDMAKHSDASGLSGMFLLYCDCHSKKLGKSMTIAAAVTRGDTNNLRVGKNAIFYDRAGNDWDATVIKVVDNPISIKQAFWSPYRKLWNWCSDKINKSAAEKDNKALEGLTSNVENAASSIPEGEKKDSKAKQAFDIAKFAGIFAAIGMAIGYISQALVSLVNGVTAKWYNLPLLVAATILVVSGPSMFLAWSKLRKRNISPILNANGWAVNASSLISVDFGKTLTSEASFPLLEPSRKSCKFVTVLLIILAVAALVLYFTGNLGFVTDLFCK